MAARAPNKKTIAATSLTTAENKVRLLAAMEKYLIVTKSCAVSKVDRTTFYYYMNHDPVFNAAIVACTEIFLDEAEDCLRKSMKANNVIAAIFVLKTKGKHRGYVEKQEIDHTSGGKAITPVVSITFHDAIDIEQIKRDL